MRPVILERRRTKNLSRLALARFANRAQRAAGLSGEVNILLTGDAEMQRLNLQFRRKDKPTDVLSFPAAHHRARRRRHRHFRPHSSYPGCRNRPRPAYRSEGLDSPRNAASRRSRPRDRSRPDVSARAEAPHRAQTPGRADRARCALASPTRSSPTRSPAARVGGRP